MSDINVSAWVTRTELSLGNLDVNDGANYVLARGITPGAVSWRKQFVESPFYEGRYVVHEVKDAVEMKIPFYVHGATYAAVHANLETLLAAFTEQSTYEVHTVIEGVDHGWTCERADYEVGFVTEMFVAKMIPIQFTTMRAPTPAAGAL